jgi:hypothetical protein
MYNDTDNYKQIDLFVAFVPKWRCLFHTIANQILIKFGITAYNKSTRTNFIFSGFILRQYETNVTEELQSGPSHQASVHSHLWFTDRHNSCVAFLNCQSNYRTVRIKTEVVSVHIMKAWKGLDIELHAFFTSELYENDWSVSSAGRLTPGISVGRTHLTGRRDKYLVPVRNQRTFPWFFSV